MSKAKKRPARARGAKTIRALAKEVTAAKAEIERFLAKELTDVKAQVEILREQSTKTNRTLLRLCCPKKWFEEEIDDDELWSDAVWEPSLRAVIDSLK